MKYTIMSNVQNSMVKEVKLLGGKTIKRYFICALTVWVLEELKLFDYA